MRSILFTSKAPQSAPKYLWLGCFKITAMHLVFCWSWSEEHRKEEPPLRLIFAWADLPKNNTSKGLWALHSYQVLWKFIKLTMLIVDGQCLVHLAFGALKWMCLWILMPCGNKVEYGLDFDQWTCWTIATIFILMWISVSSLKSIVNILLLQVVQDSAIPTNIWKPYSPPSSNGHKKFREMYFPVP